MVETHFAIPGKLETPTGGYAYDRRLMKLLPALGVNIRHLELPQGFPNPSADDVSATLAQVAATPKTATLLFDGLAYGALPAEAIAALDRRIIALVHHPLALEAGLDETRRVQLVASERAALSKAERVIVTSSMTARILQSDYSVGADKLIVAEPGTDPAHRSTGTEMPLQLLCVGAVSARKGYDVLVSALRPLASQSWRLAIVGALDRDPGAVANLEAGISELGMDDRITLTGVVVPATLESHYESADVFVMPSLFEGYGMVLAEAMARGLPIICTTGGAASETVPDSAAIKVPPGDIDALSRALADAMGDKKLRGRLADASWEAGRQLPTWQETARRVAAALLDLRT